MADIREFSLPSKMDHDYCVASTSTVTSKPVQDNVKSASRYCSVPQCKNRAAPGISFHKFPKESALLKQWVHALKIGKKVSKAMFVCSEHFKDGDFFYFDASSSQRKRLKKTAVPSCKLPVLSTYRKETAQQSAAKTNRASRIAERRKSAKLFNTMPIQSTCAENFAPPEDVVITTTTDVEGVEERDEAIAAAEALLELQSTFVGAEVGKMDAACQVSTLMLNPQDSVTLLSMIKNNSDLSAFTGLYSMELLEAISQAGEILERSGYFVKPKLQLDITERIVLTMVKLKLNISFKCISVLFHISVTTCINYFHLTIKLLSSVMEEAVIWPTKESILQNMPICFAKYKETRVVLDCTETPVEKPNCLACRIRTYSYYKGCNTLKFLIGVAPDGLITFCSSAYGGRASDKAIFMQSGLLEKLDPHSDAIMADKGFLIEKECLASGLKLIRPPFLGKSKQFTEAEGLLTASIAQARVHVERSIQRLKNFKVLKNQLQWNLVPNINDIMKTIVGVVNLSNPILAIDKF